MKVYKSLFNMIQGTCILLVALTSAAISSVFIQYSFNTSKIDVLNRMTLRLEDASRTIQQYIDDMVMVGNALSEDEKLSEAIENYQTDDTQVILDSKRMIDYIISSTMRTSRNIDNICIYNDDDIFNYNTYNIYYFGMYTNQIPQEEWFQKIINSEEKSVLILDYLNTKKSDLYDERHFIYAVPLKEMNNKQEKIIVVTVNGKRIIEILERVAETESIEVSLLNEQGQVFYSTQEEKDTKEKGDYIVTYQDPMTGWKLVGSIERKELYKQVKGIEPIIIGLMIMILALAITISYFIFRSISKPLKQLIDAMNRLGNQQFQHINIEGGYKEIIQLTHTFNQMVSQIEELIQDIQRKEREKRKVEYQVLEAQINPHFIYNTLDAIKWLALMYKAQPVAEMLTQFVKLLQTSLSGGKELITVEIEMQHIESYVHLMCLRNDSKIAVYYDIEVETLKLHTLKLILQPFVENCLVHAFDEEQINAEIKVRSYIKDEMLFFEIEDNGKGILLEHGCKSQKLFNGIGMNNIQERIQLWHGKAYGVTVETEKGKGTKIKITQPIMKE